MKELRNRLAELLVWLFIFYNIERMFGPINIVSFVYVYVLICSLAILFVSSIQRIRLFWLFLLALPPYFLVKDLIFSSPISRGLPLTVTEISAIWLTVFLSRQLGQTIDELSKTISSLLIGSEQAAPNSFDEGQGQIYREIRRARQHKETGSLMAISVRENSLEANFERVINQMQTELGKQYANVQLGKLLLNNLKFTDIVTRRNNHFVIFLPETGKDGGIEVANRIQKIARDNLGLAVNVGLSTFPDESITFDGLLDNAEAQMRSLEPVHADARLVTNRPRSETR